MNPSEEPQASGAFLDVAPLRKFVGDFSDLLDSTEDVGTILASGSKLLETLVSTDNWLPDEFAKPHPESYRQYLLHCDSSQRFSVVSFVWGPGQSTPIHDHRVWGLVGMLRGMEQIENFTRSERDGSMTQTGPLLALKEREVEAIDPREGDIHRVANAFADRTSISIHVYGANIGAVRRATYTPDGEERQFISGYANTAIPNIWDLSRKT